MIEKGGIGSKKLLLKEVKEGLRKAKELKGSDIFYV